MHVMTDPQPTLGTDPFTLPPKKKIGKGWYVLGVLVVLGAIGAISNAHDNAKMKTIANGIVAKTLPANTDSNGTVDEIGYVRDSCAGLLDNQLPGMNQTERSGLANGTYTVAAEAESFTKGYYDSDPSSTHNVSRSAIVNACAEGLRNG